MVVRSILNTYNFSEPPGGPFVPSRRMFIILRAAFRFLNTGSR